MAELLDLYIIRASAYFRQGSWVKAGEDARLGLKIITARNLVNESHPGQLKSELTTILTANGWQATLAEVQSSAGEVTVAPSIIDPDSPLGIALQDASCAYFDEAQFRELPPGSQQRFLATTYVMNCIAVLACSSDGRAFGAHVNPSALDASVYEIKVQGHGSMILENMSKAMQRVFRDVDHSEVTISLVGGWKRTDFSTELKERYPAEETMWSFSAVVRRCVAEALPGASIDTSLLNRCEGLALEDRTVMDLVRVGCQGQFFQVVALDSHTGKVETQTPQSTDFTAGPGNLMSERSRDTTSENHRLTLNFVFCRDVQSSLSFLSSDFRVHGLGFGVEVLGVGACGYVFGGSGFWVEGCGFWVEGLGFRV